jgi:hypothetical protein
MAVEDILAGVNSAGNSGGSNSTGSGQGINWVSGLGNIGSLGQAGFMLGNAIVPGIGGVVGGAIGTGAGILSDLVSYFSDKADIDNAQREAKAIDQRDFDEQVRKNRFQEAMQTQQFNLAKQKNRFAQQQAVAGNVMNLNQSMIQKLTDMVNNNQSLKSAVIARSML